MRAIALVVGIVLASIGIGAAVVGGTGLPRTYSASARNIALVDESCVSSTFCMAVGGAGTGPVAAAAELWDGTRWSPEAMAGLSGVKYLILKSISCASPRWCLALGGAELSAGAFIAVSWRWDGDAWSEPITVPSAVVRAEGSKPIVLLSNVACPSERFCLAVGETGAPNQAFVPFAAALVDGQWMKPAGGFPELLPESVSCVSASYCVTIGNLPGLAARAGVQVWNGRGWAPEQILPGRPIELGAIACTSRTSCVGLAANDTQEAVNLVWNGRVWTVARVPSAPANSFLVGISISCPTVHFCLSVVSDLPDTSLASNPGASSTVPTFRPFAMDWNGTMWRRAPSLPRGTSDVTSVSCVGPSYCMAVDSSALLWNGHTWTVVFHGNPHVFRAAVASASASASQSVSAQTGQ